MPVKPQRERMNERDRLATDLKLPERPASLLLAEVAVTKLVDDHKAAAEHFDLLNRSFGRRGVMKLDGTPYGAITDADILESIERVTQLEASLADVRRRRDALRRSYAEQVTKDLTVGCDAVCDAILDRLDQIEDLLAIFSGLKMEAAAAGITIGHRPLLATSTALSNVQSLRRNMGSRA